MKGPGKYDDECTEVRKKVNGGVVLIVIDGDKGSGFSAQITGLSLMLVPQILRDTADQIENDLKKGRL